MTNHFINVCMWIVAITYVITDRLLWPFVQSVFTELTAGVPAVVAPPVLTVAVTDAPVKEPVTKAPATPRPARRRRSKTSATVTRLGDASSASTSDDSSTTEAA